MSWKVNLYPEEQKFIEEIWSRLQIDSTGRGRYLAPIRGGIIFIDDQYYNYDEDQKKWLVFLQIHQISSLNSSGKYTPIKFMNFTYSNKIPEIVTDKQSMDRWGTKRMTTGGQPVSDITGLPIYLVQKTEVNYSKYKWNQSTKSFDFIGQQTPTINYISNDGKPLTEKIIK